MYALLSENETKMDSVNSVLGGKLTALNAHFR